MGKRPRKLLDLYKTGKEVDFGEEKVWVSKLNQLEYDDTIKHANAGRARVLAVVRDKESDEYYSICDSVLALPDDDLLEACVTTELAEYEAKAEARVLYGEDDDDPSEWIKDDYLNSLRTSWEDGLKDKYAENPEDPEAKKVFQELERFNKQVEAEIDVERDSVRDTMKSLSREAQEKKLIDRIIESRGNARWIQEYNKWCIFHSVRFADNHNEKYFENIDEVNMLDGEVYGRLLEAYREVAMEALETKKSRSRTDVPDESEDSEEDVEPVSVAG